MKRTTVDTAREMLISYLVAETPSLANSVAIAFIPANNVRGNEYHVTVGRQVVVFTHNPYQAVMPRWLRTMTITKAASNY